MISLFFLNFSTHYITYLQTTKLWYKKTYCDFSMIFLAISYFIFLMSRPLNKYKSQYNTVHRCNIAWPQLGNYDGLNLFLNLCLSLVFFWFTRANQTTSNWSNTAEYANYCNYNAPYWKVKIILIIRISVLCSLSYCFLIFSIYP